MNESGKERLRVTSDRCKNVTMPRITRQKIEKTKVKLKSITEN